MAIHELFGPLLCPPQLGNICLTNNSVGSMFGSCVTGQYNLSYRSRKKSWIFRLDGVDKEAGAGSD